MPDVAIGAFVSVWIDHTTARPEMPLRALDLAAQIVVYAVVVEELPIEATRRLWNIYFGVIEAAHGMLVPKTYGAALSRVALEAGVLDKRMAKERVTPQSTIGKRLMIGLDINSNVWIAFCAAYLRGQKMS